MMLRTVRELGFLAVALVGGMAVADGGLLVADPYRAVGTKHRENRAKGDFRFLLDPEFFTRTDDLAKEAFIDEAGLFLGGRLLKTVSTGGGAFARTIVVSDVICYGPDSRTVPAAYSLACDEPKAFVSETVVSAPTDSVPKRFLPAVARLKVTAENPFKSLVIRHGSPSAGCRIEGIDVPDGAKAVQRDGVWNVTFAAPVKETEMSVRSDEVRYQVGPLGGLSAPLMARLKTHPFFVTAPVPRWETVGLPAGNVDIGGISRLTADYPDTFLGIEVTEWDANYLQKLVRPSSQYYRDLVSAGTVLPCDRDQMVRNLKHMWDADVAHGGTNLFGMSGGITLMHYACDFGSTVSCLEFTGESPEWPWRAQMAFLRGASRQFGVPMYTYLAYFAAANQPSSDPATWSGGWGTDFGIAPSLSERLFHLGYYAGNNYIVPEPGLRGLVAYDKSGKAVLTGNGRAAKSVADWVRKPEGARGAAYAPIVLLTGRRDGYDRPVRMRPSAFYGFYPLTPAYVFQDWIWQCLSPYHGKREYDIPEVGANLRNSALGDIVDVFQADPLVHGRVTADQLDSYAVAIVAGDFDFDAKLVDELVRYVAAGGTLVLPDGRAPIPLASVPEEVKGFGFLTCERRGAGRILRFAEPWLGAGGGRESAPPKELERFLLAVQDEVVPFKVTGDCSCTYSVMPDGTWKVLVMNNRGGGKKPDVTEEKIRPEYATQARIALPACASAREVRTGAKIAADGSFTVPACGILVLEVKGIAAVRKAEQIPEVFAEWLPTNGMQDTAGRYPMTFVNCAVRDGRFVLDRPGEQQAFQPTLCSNMPWDITEATFEVVATPAEKERFPAPRKGPHRGPVFALHGSGVVKWAIEYVDGHWEATSREAGRWRSAVGPSAPAGVKAHLAAVLKDGFLRFYVNGKEYLPPSGPIKFNDPQVRDSFYGMLKTSIGTSLAAWGWFFKGEIHEVRAFSRAMKPDEIRARSARFGIINQ